MQSRQVVGNRNAALDKRQIDSTTANFCSRLARTWHKYGMKLNATGARREFATLVHRDQAKQ